MPAVSSKQLKAMYAAKAGKSALGIPSSVGADFVKATPAKKKSAFMSGKKKGGLLSYGKS